MAFYPTNVGNGRKVNVDYGTAGIVRILNDAQLKDALRDPQVGALQIARFVQSEYYYQRRQNLAITDLSLAYEILGHVYPGALLKALQSIPDIPEFVKTYLANEYGRTTIIDAGVKSLDDNRVIWDTIANVTKTMITVILR